MKWKGDCEAEEEEREKDEIRSRRKRRVRRAHGREKVEGKRKKRERSEKGCFLKEYVNGKGCNAPTCCLHLIFELWIIKQM